MSFPLFDGHCDTVYKMLLYDQGLFKNNLQVELVGAAGYIPYAQFFAIWDAPEKCLNSDRFKALYYKLISELNKNSDKIALCTSAQEAEAAFKIGKAAAFISIEGAHLIDCDINMLDRVYKMGIRALNITWNNSNKLSGSHIEEPERGLSGPGKDFVARCNELGIIMDISHLSKAGFWDVCGISSAPIIASHSNSSSICMHSRNLTDEQFRAVIRLNGTVGINFYSGFIGKTPDINSLMKHILHFLELGGEKNISIGSDFDGNIGTGMDDSEAFCRELGGISELYRLYDAMLQHGISEKTVQDIFFNNLMRVVNEVCIM